MEFNRIREKDIRILKNIVEKDRISQGISNLKLHSYDQSHHKPHLPELIIWPVEEREIVEILKYANQNRIPVTAWGAGTSLEGNPIPLFGGIVLDFSLMNKIIDIREEDFQADVQPGVIYQDLNHRLRHKGLFFAPDPGARATIGGMIGNNASGIRSVKYGSTRDNVLRIRAVLANGDVIELGSRTSKMASAYDLLKLFIGSEGTLGIVVEATVKLRGIPERSSAAFISFSDIETASRAVSEIMRYGLEPACLEIMDSRCIDVINKIKGLGLDQADTILLEFHGATESEIKESIEIAHDICTSLGCIKFVKGIEKDAYKRIIDARYSLAESIRKCHPGRLHTVMDVAVPVSAFPEIVSLAHTETKKANIPSYIFGHAGNGNLHLAFMAKEDDRTEWEIIDRIKDKIITKALSLGGTATGEHGVGIGKRRYMRLEHGKGLEWMKKIKELFDPNGILNPGKIFP